MLGATKTTLWGAAAALLLTLLTMLPASVGAQQAAVPDAVETHDGAMYRGVIIERRVDGSVVLLTPAGDTREFAGADIRYAGPFVAPPASAVPAASPGPGLVLAPATDAQRVSVWFSSDQPATLIRVSAQAVGYITSPVPWQAGTQTYAEARELLCTAPCVAQLSPGHEIFGVQLPNGRQIPIRGGEFDLLADTDLHVTVRSRLTMRIALIVVGGLLAIAGIPILLVGQAQDSLGARVAGATLLGAGIVPGLVGCGLPTYRAEATVTPHSSR